MQLKKDPQSIRAALAAATCAVLGGSAQAAQGSDDAGWQVDTSLLYYSEDERVTVIAPTAMASTTLNEDETLTLTTIIDSVTGSSPNGAAPGEGASGGAQTITTASGSVTVAPGELPMFELEDTRVAIGIDWDKGVAPLQRNVLSGSLSLESDYSAIGLSDSYSRELNQRQSTLTVAAGITLEAANPEGGAPASMTLLSAPVTTTSSSGEDEGLGLLEGERKDTIDLMLGWTQILSRRALLQLNYSHSFASGYMNDPYKIVSLIDGSSGYTLDYLYEGRPDSRDSDILYAKLVYHLDEDVLHGSYRYFSDDWGIDSHTLTLQYRYELGGGHYLQPQLRWYQQSAADFYHHSLIDGQPLPRYASADYRLAEMQSTTIGVKYAMTVGNPERPGEFSLRVARMVQSGDGSPADAVGVQQLYDLYPDLNATIVQLNYRFWF